MRQLVYCAIVWGVILSLNTTCLGQSEAVMTTKTMIWSEVFEAGQNELIDGKLDRAEVLLRKALSLVKSQSANFADVEKCMLKLADVLALRDKTTEAETLYQDLLNKLISKYGKDSTRISPVLVAMGSIQESEGNHTAAIGYYKRALSISEKNYGAYSPAVADSLSGLVKANLRCGNKTEAKKHYKRALSILSGEPGLSASKQLEILVHDYGDLLKGDEDSNQELIEDFKKDILNSKDNSKLQLNQQKLQPANAKVSKSTWHEAQRHQLNVAANAQIGEASNLALSEIQKSSSSSALAPAFSIVNETLLKQSHFDKDEEFYQRASAIDLNSLGPNHPSLANDLNNLAQLYIVQEKFIQAEPLLQRALSIYEKAYGQKNVLTISTLASLAFVEFHLGKSEKAAEFYTTALGDGEAVLGPNSLELARILNEYAYLCFYRGNLKDACTFYQWAIASTEGAVGERDPLLAACLRDYAQVLRSLGKADEAERVDSRAQMILGQAKGSL